MHILLSSEETLYQVSTRTMLAKGRAEQVSAELFFKLKRSLPKKQFQEQSGYITTAAQAAFASLNKLDWTKEKFCGEVNLTPNSETTISFDRDSSSAGLGYAIALALEWRKQLNKPTDYEAEVFATGEIHSSGAVTEIGHLDTKITAACNFMEKKNTAPHAQQPFVIFYPNANQDDVTPELQTRVAELGGKLCPVERLQSALTILLGDAYDGDAEGRWEPFKGLLSFNYEDCLRFFGRERALTKLSKEFNEAEGLLVVTGVSGSGKSSLIKAGLIPQINKELPEGNTLDWLISTPKAHISVESMLVELLYTLDKHWSLGASRKDNSEKDQGEEGKNSDLDALSKEAIQSPDTFIAAIKQAQLLQPNKRIFYYIDQYEDIFNHQDISREQAQQLTPLLAQLAKQIPNLDIVISIRSEYEDILGKYGSVSHVNPELNASEWGDIVYKQATSFGLRYEPELEKRIVNEASSIQHALPALEYLLEQLYKKAKEMDENARVLTHEHYEQLNGICGVIAARAEEAIALHPDQANAFFEYFIGLNGEGMPCTKSVSLTFLEKENLGLYKLIQTFIAERLVIDCGSQQLIHKQEGQALEKCVKIAHDTLLNVALEVSSWQRLKVWFENNHDYLVWFKQIEPDFLRWDCLQMLTNDNTLTQENEELTTTFLLKNVDLKYVQQLQKKNSINNPQVNSYIQASQQHQIEQLENDKSAQRKRFIVVAMLLVTSLIAGGYAYIKEQEAIAQQERAESLIFQVQENIKYMSFDLNDSLVKYLPTSSWIEFHRHIDAQLKLLDVNNIDNIREKYIFFSNKAKKILLDKEGEADNAIKFLLYSKKLVEEKIEVNSDDLLYQSDLSFMYLNLGHAYKKTAQFAKAESAYIEASIINKIIVKQEPSEIRYAKDLSLSTLALGDLFLYLKKWEGAEINYLNALKIHKEFNLELDDGAFALINERLGALYLRTDKLLPKALEHFEKAYSYQEFLSLNDPNNNIFKWNLFVAQNNIGKAYLKKKERKKAKEAFEKALKIIEVLYEYDPLNINYNQGISNIYSALGDLHLYLGNNKKALLSYEFSLGVYQKLNEDHPGNIDYLKELAIMYGILADFYFTHNEFDNALKLYLESIDVGHELIGVSHNNLIFYRGLQVSLKKSGDLYVKTNDTEKALAAYTRMLDIRWKLLKNEPENIEYKWGILRAHEILANLYTQTNDKYLAISELGKALSFAKELKSKLYLSDVLRKKIELSGQLASIYVDRKSFQPAEIQYQNILGFSKELSSLEPNNHKVFWGSSLTYFNLSLVYSALGKHLRAINANETAIKMHMVLLSKNKSSELYSELTYFKERLTILKK